MKQISLEAIQQWKLKSENFILQINMIGEIKKNLELKKQHLESSLTKFIDEKITPRKKQHALLEAKRSLEELPRQIEGLQGELTPLQSQYDENESRLAILRASIHPLLKKRGALLDKRDELIRKLKSEAHSKVEKIQYEMRLIKETDRCMNK